MVNFQEINIDMVNPRISPPPIVKVKQFDSKSRTVKISIYENGIPVDLSHLSEETFTVYFNPPKGDTVYDEAEIHEGKVIVSIPQNAIMHEGRVTAELQITLNQRTIGSMNFYVDVEKSVWAEDAIESDDIGNPIEELKNKQDILNPMLGVKILNSGDKHGDYTIGQDNSILVNADETYFGFGEDDELTLNIDEVQKLTKGQIAQNFNQSEQNPLQFSDNGDGSYEMKLNCDTEISEESENPVQNKVLKSILDDKADKEYVGNYVINYTQYYAEKKMGTSTVLNNPLTANCNYFFTVDDNFILSFPTEDLTQGDTIYLNFECSTDVTLIVDTSNTTAIDIIPEANKGYEVFGCWNGNKWVLGYDEYDLPVTSAE